MNSPVNILTSLILECDQNRDIAKSNCMHLQIIIFGSLCQTQKKFNLGFYCSNSISCTMRWLDWMFQGQYFPTLSINFVAINIK